MTSDPIDQVPVLLHLRRSENTINELRRQVKYLEGVLGWTSAEEPIEMCDMALAIRDLEMEVKSLTMKNLDLTARLEKVRKIAIATKVENIELKEGLLQ